MRILRGQELYEHRAREDPKNIPEKVRDEVLERDNNQCQLCGTGGENRLQLHHIEFRSQGGTHDPVNLVTLCFKCHEEVHSGKAGVGMVEISPNVFAAFPRNLKTDR